MEPKKKRQGRPRIGQPVSITFTEEQIEWLDSKTAPGRTRSQVMRTIIDLVMQKGVKIGCSY